MAPVTSNLLSLLVLLPVAGAVLRGARAARHESAQKLLGARRDERACSCSRSLLVRDFQPTAAMQFVEERAWIPAYGISYKLGIDGLSLWLVILTTFLTPLACSARGRPSTSA